MNRIIVVLGLAIALAGCKSAGQQAEEQYDIVKRHGTQQQVCDAAKAAAAAYLGDRDEDHYRQWRVVAGIECLSLEIDQAR